MCAREHAQVLREDLTIHQHSIDVNTIALVNSHDGRLAPIAVNVRAVVKTDLNLFSTSEWLQLNSIADGMNLVAKEGPIVNHRSGVLVLSERTGAYQQLEPGVLVVSPLDIYGTAEAIHRALTMSTQERHQKAGRLRSLVESHDVTDWLQQQLNTIIKLKL